jgi:uncharacterized protein involved in exopolysaccharide biosynthesis
MTMHVKAYETPKREFLVFYYKYRLRLLCAFLLPFLLSVFISFMPTPRYEATSTLVVRLGSEYVYQPETGAGTSGPASPIPFDRDQMYKAEVAILGSYDLHEQVIRTVGLDRMYPAGETSRLHKLLLPARNALLKMLDSLAPDGSDSTMGSIATDLRASLNDYEDDTKASEEEKARKRLQMAVENFDQRLDIVLGKESAVINVSFQHRNREIAIQALDTLLKLYLEKRKQLYTETPRAATAQAEADKTRRRAIAGQEAVENFKRVHKIYSLADQRTQLLAQREEVRKQMQSVANSALDDKLTAVTSQLDELDAQERQYNALQEDLQRANDEYTLYAHKLDEAQSYDNLERSRASSVRIVQDPAAPPEPKRLQKIIILAGFMVSLIFTVLIAALTEFSRSGFLTPERLERNLGLPILVALPRRK